MGDDPVSPDGIKTRIAVIGDSYSDPIYYEGYETEKVVLWHEQLDSNLFDVTVQAEGGAGFFNKGIRGHDFIQLLQKLQETDETYDWLIVYGGTNDKNAERADVESAIVSFMETIQRSKYRNIVFCIGNSATVLTREGLGLTLFAIPLISEYDIPVLDSWWWLAYEPNVSTKTGHPNQAGQDLIAQRMISAILQVSSNAHEHC